MKEREKIVLHNLLPIFQAFCYQFDSNWSRKRLNSFKNQISLLISPYRSTDKSNILHINVVKLLSLSSKGPFKYNVTQISWNICNGIGAVFSCKKTRRTRSLDFPPPSSVAQFWMAPYYEVIEPHITLKIR